MLAKSADANQKTTMQAEISQGLQVFFGGYSSAGLKEENQDAFAAYSPSSTSSINELMSKGAVAVLADGLSCANKAAEASQLAVTQFISDYYATPETWSTRKSAAKVLYSPWRLFVMKC